MRPGARSAFGVVIGVAGTGKTRLLDSVVLAAEKDGVTVVRLAGSEASTVEVPALPGRLGEPPWLLTVDDAHRLDGPTLAAITELARRARAVGGGVVATHRPASGHCELSNLLDGLDSVLASGREPIMLRPWTRAKVASLPPVGGDLARATEIFAATAGNPRLTAILAAARPGQTVPDEAVDVVGAELDRLPARTRLVAAAMAADRTVEATRPDLASLIAGALTGPDGAMPALVRAAIASISRHDHLTAALAEPLAEPRAEPAAEPASGGALAERAWRDGDTATAIEAADRTLAAGDDPGCLAAGVAAAVAAADGALLDAANRWRGVATAIGGGVPGALAAGRAALAASLVGDVEAAAHDVTEARRTLPATAPRGLTVLLDGVDAVTQAVRGGFDRAARRLAGLAVATVPADPLAPERWDDLAVTVMLAGGDDQTARDMLAAQPDHSAGTRRRLLAAWLDVRSGRLAEARDGLAGAGGTRVLRRDAVLAAAVTVALARRAADADALRATWHRVAPVVAGADVELLLLDAWGELSAAAAQVSPAARDSIVEAMTAAVARAGSPSWAVATLAWWRLQRAVAVSEPAGVPDGPAIATITESAEQLAEIAEHDRRFAAQAAAALAWTSVLAGAADQQGVARAAQALAGAGRPWEAATLCGTAAGRLTDQAMARDLLGAGRSYRAMITTADRAAGRGLSERERAVGGLLLDGLTHKEIGARLYISPKTVEQHVARLRQKLLASSRGELVAALRARLAPTG